MKGEKALGHNCDMGLPAGASSVARRGPRPIPLLTKLRAACGASGYPPSRWNRAPEDAAMTPADWLHPALGPAHRGRSRPRKVNPVAAIRRIAGALAVLGLSGSMGCVSTPQGPPPGSRVRQIFDPAPCEFRGTVTGGAVASETRALANARDNVARMGGNSIFVINVESQPWTFLGEEMPPNVTVTAEAYWCGGGPS